MKVKDLITLLQEDTNPDDDVLFDVKSVDGFQDFAHLSDIYWDEELILQFR